MSDNLWLCKRDKSVTACKYSNTKVGLVNFFSKSHDGSFCCHQMTWTLQSLTSSPRFRSSSSPPLDWVDLVSPRYIELWCSMFCSLTLVSVMPSCQWGPQIWPVIHHRYEYLLNLLPFFEYIIYYSYRISLWNFERLRSAVAELFKIRGDLAGYLPQVWILARFFYFF